jgi:putative nucleotidyltransferase with HDIG domain
MTNQTNTRIERELLQLPEILAGRNLIQNEYHQFDVYDHTIAVIESLKEFKPNEDLIAAACLHDIGKPIVAKPRIYKGIPQLDAEGRQRHTFPDHEIVGAKIVRNLDNRLFNNLGLNQENIARLVEAHYLPMTEIGLMRATENPIDFERNFQRLKNSLSNRGFNLSDLMDLFAADSLGKGDIWGDLSELLEVRGAVLGKNNLELIYNMQKAQGGKKYGYARKE